MKTASTLLLILSLFAAHAASAACPNGNCSRSSATIGGSNTISYMKGKNIDGSARPTISDVAGSSITVKSKAYQIDANTLIFVNGKQAGKEQLQKGMRATVKTSALKPTLASTITATSGK